MYRVLIVDDEEPVLDSYAFLLEMPGTEFSLVGKGRSGFEAIKLIHELKPDVVFMDINIPGIDGIEVIAEVHKKVPGTIFILSTAYERFDLAQRAIPLGIFAYLVKPVSKKTFLSTLEAVRSALLERSPVPPILSGDLAERQFLKEAIWKRMTQEEWEKYKDSFSFHSDKGIVCLIELEEDQDRWCRAIAASLFFHHRCLFTLYHNKALILIPEDVDRRLLVKELEEIIRTTVPESVFSAFAVGESHRGPDLYLSCGEALTEMGKKRSYADLRLRERLRIIQIRRRIGLSSSEETESIFRALWEDIFGTYDFPTSKAKMVALFTLLIDDLTGCYSGPNEEDPPIAPAEEIMPLLDSDEWEAWSREACGRLHDLFSLRRSGNYPLPLIKAIGYLHERYAEQIQLSTVSDAAQVSTAYLSRLFSEHLKTTFIDYLTELRVAKAEKLIRETRMTMKEVSHAVGYQDPNYFTKIFKKATGLPPTMYALGKEK
ncbi:MAG: DNA-binding response regulator [Treponema sp. GWB1_62_6]|nr:MAG: DNA-binding response regulator [Treponema sp. GWB1_62_6]OHE67674.1 MAG: DNA-binding response regulator [Treponema sp. GWA1_62_8]OHE68022.1 MAG: DNA-binding response regulator [Treponema sp. GWC1_61_84]OHE71414.1 MAG: DNA-binding response regulator [Treponema sp. RIFOXYC1_FULL_61_9]HCM27012.1 DNA-binding response regulator [Treponema sp.]